MSFRRSAKKAREAAAREKRLLAGLEQRHQAQQRHETPTPPKEAPDA